MDSKDKYIWLILTAGLLIGGFAFAVTGSRAEDHDLRKDCYINMSQKQVVVCLESLKIAVEDMAKQTKQILADVKPVNTES